MSSAGSTIDVAVAPTAPVSPGDLAPEHVQLGALAGEWVGRTELWLDADAPPEESASRARFEAILGGRFLRVQYTGTAMGGPHAGEMLFGFEKNAREYTLAWADSVHTGTALMISKGTPGASGVVSVLGSYATGPGPEDPRWGWRTVLHADPAALVLEAFNISPDGHEMPAIRTTFTRA